jgi:putative transcriptional regulator
MTITHHLDDATLMSFSAGALPAALAAVAAAHAAMCPRCRREIAALERIGGALMASLPAAATERPEPIPPAGERGQAVRQVPLRGLPGPVAQLVPGGLDAVSWRWLGPGVWDRPLSIAGAGKLRLLKVAPGRKLPEHGHGGGELTLVLRGSFHDNSGHYLRGDVCDLDESAAHQPIAGEGDHCICLVASEAPEQFRSHLTRRWQRLRGF